MASEVGKKIVVQNHYYPKPGKFDEVLVLRIAASKLLKEFGLSSGQVLVNRQVEGDDAPIIWQSEYESNEALKKEMNACTPEQEKRFEEEILKRMKTRKGRWYAKTVQAILLKNE